MCGYCEKTLEMQMNNAIQMTEVNIIGSAYEVNIIASPNRAQKHNARMLYQKKRYNKIR